jgi:hypothetical protein
MQVEVRATHFAVHPVGIAAMAMEIAGETNGLE